MKNLIKQNKIDIGYDFAGTSNYIILTIKDENILFDGQLQTMSHSKTEFFLSARKIQINNSQQLFYDITDKATLSQLIKSEPLEKSIFLHIFESILNAMIEVKEIGLFDTGVLLDKKYIFFENIEDYPSFIYLPFYEESNGIKNILDFINELEQGNLLRKDYALEVSNIKGLASKEGTTVEELLFFVNDLVLLNPLIKNSKKPVDEIDFNDIKIDKSKYPTSSNLVSLKHQDFSNLIDEINIDNIDGGIEEFEKMMRFTSEPEEDYDFSVTKKDVPFKEIDIIKPDGTEKIINIDENELIVEKINTDGEFEIFIERNEETSLLRNNYLEDSIPEQNILNDEDKDNFENDDFEDNNFSVLEGKAALLKDGNSYDEDIILDREIKKDIKEEVIASAEDDLDKDVVLLGENVILDGNVSLTGDIMPNDNEISLKGNIDQTLAGNASLTGEILVSDKDVSLTGEFFDLKNPTLDENSVKDFSQATNDFNNAFTSGNIETVDFNKRQEITEVFDVQQNSINEPQKVFDESQNSIDESQNATDKTLKNDVMSMKTGEDVASLLKRIDSGEVIETKPIDRRNIIDKSKEEVVIKENISSNPALEAFQKRQRLFDLSDVNEEPFTIKKDEFKLEEGDIQFSDREDEKFVPSSTDEKLTDDHLAEVKDRRNTTKIDRRQDGAKKEDEMTIKLRKRGAFEDIPSNAVPVERRGADRLKLETKLADKNRDEFSAQLLKDDDPISLEDLILGDISFGAQPLTPNTENELVDIENINISESIASLDGASEPYRERRHEQRDEISSDFFSEDDIMNMRSQTHNPPKRNRSTGRQDERFERVSNVGSDINSNNEEQFVYEEQYFSETEDKRNIFEAILDKIPFIKTDKKKYDQEEINTKKPKKARQKQEDDLFLEDNFSDEPRRDIDDFGFDNYNEQEKRESFDKQKRNNKIVNRERITSEDFNKNQNIDQYDKNFSNKNMKTFIICQAVMFVVIMILAFTGYFGKIFRQAEIYEFPAENIIARVIEKIHASVNIPLAVVTLVIILYLEYFFIKNILLREPKENNQDNFDSADERIGQKETTQKKLQRVNRNQTKVQDFDNDMIMPGKEISNTRQRKQNFISDDTEETEFRGGRSIPFLTTKVEGTIQKIYLSKPSFVIGRFVGKVDYVSKSNKVGKVHLEIISRNGVYYVSDLESTNGTYINSYRNRLQSNVEYPIDDGDIIIAADVEFIFHLQ